MKIPSQVWNCEKLPTARGRTCFVLVALAASLSLLGGGATAQRPAEPKPLWQSDARKFGLPPRSVAADLMLFKIGLSQGRFGFQNNDTLLVSWITPDGPRPHVPKKASPIPAVPVPCHLHVLFLDTKTGTRLREGEVSVPSGPAELFISHSGNLLVRAGNSLKLYTPNFVLLNQTEIPAPANWGTFNASPKIEISPDGHKITVCSAQGASWKTAIFDADDLKSLGSLPDGQERCPEQLGDNSFLFMTMGISRQFTVQNGEYELHNFTVPVAGGSREVAHLLNADAFMVTKGNAMVIRTIDGKELMTDSLPEGHGFWPWHAAEARDSTIFAVETTRLTLQVEGIPPIPILIPTHLPSGHQIAVYSLTEKRRIFAVKVRTDNDNYALSPDGSLLGTLSKGWVRVYKLP